MFSAVYMCAFGFGVISPEDEDQILPFVGEFADDRVGKFFPPVPLMRAGIVRGHCECRIKEEYSLLCPALQIAGSVHKLLLQVTLYFFIDVLKRRREINSLTHGEAEAIGLSPAVVWVLPEYHDLNFIKRTELKSAENIFRWRVYDGVLVFAFNELPQFLEIILLELVFERLFPRAFYFDPVRSFILHNQC